MAPLALSPAAARVAELKPAPGQSLPVKPLMARTTPTAEELLTPPTYARPERVDELIKRSQPRGPIRSTCRRRPAAPRPPLPAGTDPQPVPNETGPGDSSR